ncbi:MAG: nicotinate (nicotinamide) nucleotide adenylyltransferase [Treponema sp.]|nr:nicotinate (nicotinamide) nucleotide adenylyltransferase [Treponema sp.]
MRFAILGGSFNPVHLGHLYLAEAALSFLDYDRVIFVPAFRSPFKTETPGAAVAAPDRFDMLASSLAGSPDFALDNCEIKREGVSYTIDTVIDIEKRYRPSGKPGLILGDDLAADLPSWRSFEDLLEKTDIIIARRVLVGEHSFPYPFRQIDNDVMNISSALVRERIRTGKLWRSLVPSGAGTIIEDRRLYGYTGEGEADENPGREDSPKTDGRAEGAVTKDLLVKVENAARESLSAGRFLHSRNTALLAWDLCRRFGLPPQAGYLAGVAHDIGKPLSGERLLELASGDGEGISALERKKPSLLHGRAAAVLLRERFGIHNDDVIEAVAFHTEGRDGMGPLAKAVYIADKIEVSRDADPALRDMACGRGGESLDGIFAAVLGSTVDFLRSRRLDVSEATVRLLDAVRKRNSR